MDKLIEVRQDNLAVDMMMDIDDAYKPDVATLMLTQRLGSTEPEVINVFRHVLHSGDTVIDGGANTGYLSLIMAALVGSGGHVLAFEPGPDNLAKLRYNVTLNGARQITIIDQPLFNRVLPVTLYLAEDSGEHSLAPFGVHQPLPMESTTIDFWQVSPRLIKLDIEGSEVHALQGAVNTILANRTYVVCEMNDGALRRFNTTGELLRQTAKKLFNYDTWLLLNIHFYPLLLPPGVRIESPHQNINVLFATPQMVAEAFPVIAYG